MAVKKRNIFLQNTLEASKYRGQAKQSGGKRIPERADISKHGAFLQEKLKETYDANTYTTKQVAAIRYKDGIYLEFSGQENHDLITKSLENIKDGVRLLNVRFDDETQTRKATVYVPAGKEAFFLNRIKTYMTETTKSGAPKNADLVNSIEDIRLALLNAFWTGKKTDVPLETPIWCEIWLRVTDKDKTHEQVENLLKEKCVEIELSYKDNYIRFPERSVMLIRANATQIGEFINRFEYIAEIRRAPDAVSFFDKLPPNEQKEWVDNLLSRITYDFSNTSVCILDTGVSAGHSLLAPALESDTVQAVYPHWEDHDHDGHGTAMAGVALFNDLTELLASDDAIALRHRIESVKILPSTGENSPELYGDITQRAAYIAEIARPKHNRALCMAITSSRFNTEDGSPTSWSGAVDNLTSSALGDGRKRLMFVSAGNVRCGKLKTGGYPNANVLHSVESPGQAWNAITVGAYSDNVTITEPSMGEYTAVADVGQLSPYSSTSATWSSKWPIKPEILCDGGNVASDGNDYSNCADLSLLTTNHQPLIRLFNTIEGTSAATAQAAWLAAQIMVEYPNAWPETIRGLIIHSAKWTDKMKEQFCNLDKKTTGRKELLRTCGYGIPNLERALQCMNNSVNLVIEGEIQPYSGNEMNEMHIHNIPWPQSVLRGLDDVEAEMKVTLSYFIEPGPGEIGWENKYRYASCGLRFDVMNKNENKADFLKRINVAMRGENKKDKGDGTSGSEDWYLGTNNRDVGSIHSDTRTQNAVELCDANCIAVYPVVGWWRERTHLDKANKKVRYSLIVSISTPKVDEDLYTPIITQIATTTTTATKLPIAVAIKRRS